VGPTRPSAFYAGATADYLRAYFDGHAAQQKAKAAEREPAAAPFPREEVRAIAAFGPVVRPVLSRAREVVSVVRDRLSSPGRGGLVNCGKERELTSVGSLFTGGELGVEEATEIMARRALRLITLYARERLDCACSCFNPGCPVCDDPGVLLACFEVRDCCVEGLCNLERDFVLTGPNLRYWLPTIDREFELVERMCCPERCEDEERRLGERFDALERVLEGKLERPEPARVRAALTAFRRVVAPRTEPALAPQAPPGPSAAVLADQLRDTRRELDALRQAHDQLRQALEEIRTARPGGKR
jgi:hypothetical protein